MKKTIFTLCLLLIIAFATYGNGFQSTGWDTQTVQLTNKFGTADGYSNHDGKLNLAYRGSFEGKDCNSYYIFEDGVLSEGLIVIERAFYQDNLQKDYNDLIASLNSRYGSASVKAENQYRWIEGDSEITLNYSTEGSGSLSVSWSPAAE